MLVAEAVLGILMHQETVCQILTVTGIEMAALTSTVARACRTNMIQHNVRPVTRC